MKPNGLGRCLVALLAIGMSFLAPVEAQEFPARALRIIVPYSAGGAVDGPTRVIAAEMSRRLGQQVVVENRPGAGATIGTDAVAKAAPDGYTLLLTSQTNAISATLYAKLPYDPIGDFAPISLLGREPGVLVTHPSFPAKTVAELIAHVKQQPGRIDFASSGNGSGQHLFAALFAHMAGLRMNHVPYRGSGQATADLLSGQIPMAMPGLAGMLGHVRAGKLRALAVTGTARAPQLPEVPTLDEAGVKGYAAYVWFGLMAPRATAPGVLARLHREVTAALNAPEVRTYFDNAAIETAGSTPAELAQFFRTEKERWAVVIRDTGARID